jgi:hypothetical protein
VHPARLAPDPAAQAYATLVPVCSTWTRTRRRVGPRAACPGRQRAIVVRKSASRKRGNRRSAPLADREALDREPSHKLRAWCLGQVSVRVVSTRAPTVAWWACGPRRSDATPSARASARPDGRGRRPAKPQDVSTGELPRWPRFKQRRIARSFERRARRSCAALGTAPELKVSLARQPTSGLLRR